MNFEQFCEYLLPYKTHELQQLDNWRGYLAEQFGRDIEGLGYCDDYRHSAVQATMHVNRNLWNNLHPVISINRIMPVRRFSTRVRLPFGTCADYTEIATAAFRSCGIPVAYDFTPQWPFRSMGHTWNVLLANSGKTMPFAGTESNPGEPHKLDEKMAKVFRWTYVANPELLRLEEVEGYIPPTFRTPFLRDVTAEYMDCTDVEVEIENGTDGRYAYLAVFDNDSWVPVDFARINDGRACFKNVGRNIAYLPLRYDADDEDIPAGAPFILTYEGKAEKIVADTIHRQAVNLLRKYPATPHACTWSWRALNGVFQAADNPEFERAETIYEIKGWAVSGTEVVVPDSCGAYRYWRYWQPHEFCNMAEICFISKQTGQFVEGRIIGTEGSWGNNGNDRSKAFDHNPLTFFDAPCHGAWVGVDFGEPIALDKILYVWRGDGNTVEIGDEYELLYWNNGGWRSLGKQKADRMNLVYKNVPMGALFWLRDLTKGKEERIFTYEDDRQIWW